MAVARLVGLATLSSVAALMGCPADDRVVELADPQALSPGAGGPGDGGFAPNGPESPGTGVLEPAAPMSEVLVPELAVSVDGLAWGPLPLGLAGQKGFKVVNVGDGVMSVPVVSLAAPSDPAFAILLNRCEEALEPDESCEVRIQFSPVDAVESSVSLLVDAGVAGSATLALSGAGLATGTLVLAPTAESSSEFGLIAVGETATRLFSLINPDETPSGVLSLSLNSDQFEIVPSGNAGDCVSAQTNLMPGASCVIGVAFTPVDRGRADASLVVQSAELGAAGINVSGSGLGAGTLEASVEQLDFQGVVRGQVAVAELSLENAGDLGLPLGAMAIGGQHAADFSIALSTCGELLDGGASCVVEVQFSPSDVGARSGALSIDVAGAPREFVLAGTGLQPGSLVLVPAADGSADFADVLVGQSRAQAYTLQNPGAQPSGAIVSISGGNDFEPLPPSQSTDCQAGVTSLVNGESCTISVSFAPTQRARRQASLTVESPLTGVVALPLIGRGILPPDIVSLTDVVDFSDVVVNEAASGTIVVTNQGDQPLPPPVLSLDGALAQAFTYESGCMAPLAPEARCEIAVTFEPVQAVRHSVTLRLDGGIGGSTTVALRGNAVAPGSLVLAPAANNSAQFGDVGLDVERTQTFTLTNPGGVPTGPLSITVLNNDNSGTFSRVAPAGTDCNDASNLVDGESCTVRVRFLPRTNVSFGGTLRASSPTAGIQNLTLSGRGVRAAILNRSESRDFGSRARGDTSRPQDFTRSWTVTNGGDVASAALTLTETNPGEFVIVANGCTAALAPTAGCTLSVEFRPAAVGRRTGTITLAAGSAASVVLSMSGLGFQRSGPGGTCNTVADCEGGTNAAACGNGANGTRVCCESACQGTCEFCNGQGQCVALQGGEACSANDPRRGCFGRNRCLLPNGQTCSGDNANCSSGNCETAVGGGATVCCGANCALGQECSANFAACQASLGELGDACGTDSDCEGGLACGQSLDGAGGRCCQSACTGPCRGCDASGSCVARPQNTACGTAGQRCLNATTCDYPTCAVGSVVDQCRIRQ